MDSSRIFDPVRKGFPWWVQPSDIVWYDDNDEVSRISQTGRRSRMPVVVWVDGACRGNGTAEASASYGIYLGQNSRYNTSRNLPYYENHSSQAAEIYAASQAVEETLTQLGEEVCQDGVVIITDSSYMFQAITGHVYNWEDNGFLNCKGGRVVNGEAFKKLHDLIDAWEEESGAKIRFWKVPREQNQNADRLAKAAL